jgi:hypothetical protein
MSARAPSERRGRAVDARATLAQMRTGPWPVVAPARVWALLTRRGWVRATPAFGGRPVGFMITGAGARELELLETPLQPPSRESPAR